MDNNTACVIIGGSAILALTIITCYGMYLKHKK